MAEKNPIKVKFLNLFDSTKNVCVYIFIYARPS